ncbi:TonB-linked outer membrane protein, SusC/RagA family [Chryseolinea serpens]|uniref:TonB-linked outer membrane protein, SusC/RagA family n=1 Tax=Chryseolinea serpens TaxID=947013 RepID=A0A1M5TCI5_9BACT|nr:TonB-dependent receptor [Chryseolinea serpens]SHH48401.1 TonB-linked outer membrane protein, SusC/RagA family [Chryseolinea serpens]
MSKNFTSQWKGVFLLALLLAAMLCYQPAHAQGSRVSGRISDGADGSPIPGVNVIVKGTSTGSSTDANGSFVINVEDPNAVLVFSFIGYSTQEIPLNGKSSVDVVMQPDTQTLGEVVVVGYGSQSQREVTGSVQQVKGDEFKDIPVSQITQKLQGRLTGVQISQNTGKPGQGMQVRIRGQISLVAGSDPLYVVDGFPIVGDISNINPDEIENISVLKDAASTSLYGSRAANGVVMVTTKKAQAGRTTVGFSAYYGVQQVPQKGRPQVMNGQEFAQFKKESAEDLGVTPDPAFQNPSQYGKGYDWYDAMLRSAPIQNYSVSLASSNDKASASAVLGYFNQDGVLLNSNYKRYSLRVNTEYKVSDKVKIGFNAAPLFSINNTPSTDGAFYATNQNSAVPGGLLNNALLTWPILPYKNADGTVPLTAFIPGVSAFPTPNWYRSLNDVTNKTQTTRLISNAFVQFELLKGLTFKTSLNADVGNSNFINFKPTTASEALFTPPPPTISTSIRNETRYYSWLNENTLTYKTSFGDHNLEILGGFSSQRYRMDYTQTRWTDFSDDRLKTLQTATNIDRTQSRDDVQEWSLLSYFARANYNFKGKYLFSVALRRDGSSRFGSDNKWGTFPSVSAGWNISDEAFMSGVKPISVLKLRASYGTVGNNNIGNYTQYATVSTTTNAIFGSTLAPGASLTTLGNKNLGWETTKAVDVGLDVGLFNDRISFVYDFYTKNTSNLLYSVAVPQESGFQNFNGNIGELKFWGHEFTISSKNTVGKVKWNTDFNIAFNDNKVVALSAGVDRIYGGQNGYATLTQVGHRVGQFWGMVQDGVYKNQADFDSSPKAAASQVGTVKFKDVNGDGVITNGGDKDDRTYIGNPFPTAVFGLTNTVRYSNFDLTVVLSGTHGNSVAVMTDQGTTNLDGVFNVLKEVKDRWRSPENPGAGKYGKTTSGTANERDWFHTRFISDGSNITVRNITLGYNVPLKRNFISGVRLYASVQNLYRFTNYRGPNPEANAATGGDQSAVNATNMGFDWATFPVPVTYTFGLNASFK